MNLIIWECHEMEKAEKWELDVISSSLLPALPPLSERLEQA